MGGGTRLQTQHWEVEARGSRAHSHSQTLTQFENSVTMGDLLTTNNNHTITGLKRSYYYHIEHNNSILLFKYRVNLC